MPTCASPAVLQLGSSAAPSRNTSDQVEVRKTLRGSGESARTVVEAAWVPVGSLVGWLMVGELEPEWIGGPMYAGFLCHARFGSRALSS